MVLSNKAFLYQRWNAKGLKADEFDCLNCSIAPFLNLTMNADTQYEDSVSVMVLENIKNKLLQAFRTPAEPRSSNEADACPIGKSSQVNEELRRAKIDGAITWLRSELLEMRSQDRQLAQTLLGLNREIQRLRRENGSLLLEENTAVTGH